MGWSGNALYFLKTLVSTIPIIGVEILLKAGVPRDSDNNNLHFIFVLLSSPNIWLCACLNLFVIVPKIVRHSMSLYNMALLDLWQNSTLFVVQQKSIILEDDQMNKMPLCGILF